MQNAPAQLSQAVRPPSGAGPRAVMEGERDGVFEREVAFSRSGVGVEGLLGDVVVVIGEDIMEDPDGVELGDGSSFHSWGVELAKSLISVVILVLSRIYISIST